MISAVRFLDWGWLDSEGILGCSEAKKVVLRALESLEGLWWILDIAFRLIAG